MDPHSENKKTFNTNHKSLKRDNINKLCLCLKEKQKGQIITPSTFQTSDIELLSPKIEI